MIVERITLGAIYRTLVQLEINEGKVRDIVLDYKIGDKVLSPPVFDNLESLKFFITTQYPYIPLNGSSEICTWNAYKLVKFWVDKDNGIQVQNKAELTVTKGTLFEISKKRLRELNTYTNSVLGFIHFDNYIKPFTASYVECVYIDDIIEDGGFEKADLEYKKYAKL